MSEFIVEFTSANPCCPKQQTYRAATPEEAITAALRDHGVRSLLRQYDRESDPNQSYRGWSHITISVDCNPEGVREFEQDEIPGYEPEDEED